MVSPVTPNLHLLWERLKAAMMRSTRGVFGVMVSSWRGHSGQDNAHSRITARLLLLLLCHYMPRCWVLLPALVLSLNCTAVAAPTAAQQQRQQQCGGAVVRCSSWELSMSRRLSSWRSAAASCHVSCSCFELRGDLIFSAIVLWIILDK